MRVCILLILWLFMSNARAQTFRLTFSDSTTIPLLRDSLRGISGLAIDPATKQWHLVSDRGWHFIFSNVHTLRDLHDSTRLTMAEKTPYWFEGIRYDSKQKLYFWADEHEYVTSVLSGSSLQGIHSEVLLKMPLPGPNKGLEGIALTPSGALWVAPEAGWEGETRMAQDTITFYRYPNPLAIDPLVERYRYPISRCPFAQKEEQLGGISEIVSLDEQRMLVLERCYDAVQKQVTAGIYLATMQPGTTQLRKECVFDFSRDFPGIPCNLEAMAWADADHKTLVLMADDNFRQNRTLKNQVIVLTRQ